VETPVKEAISADAYYEELRRLFHLYRLANLNARYYGCRADTYEWYAKIVMIIGAVLSVGALSLLLGFPPNVAPARTVAVVFSGVAGFLSGVTPFLGWTEKIREMRSLHFAYSQLFGQIERVITEIRRVEELLPEHVGMARIVHESYMRLDALDELQPKQKLIDREDAKVRASFPDDYLWKNM